MVIITRGFTKAGEAQPRNRSWTRLRVRLLGSIIQ